MPPATYNPSRRRRGWHWLVYVGVAVVAILGVAAIAGEFYESLLRDRDERQFRRWGDLVDVGGYRLNLNCIGEGSPTVILDSTLGMPAAEWSLVQPDVAEFAHVCSFDRAGYGWSDRGPLPRTALQNSQELRTLLHNHGVSPPYILVGSGLGGLNARVYSHAFPAEVAGLVLVDSDHEDQMQRLPPEFNDFDQQQSRSLHRWQPFIPMFTHIGAMRIFLQNRPHPAIPSDVMEELRFLQLRGSYFDAVVAEMDGMPLTRDEARASGSLGTLPLLVLTADDPARDLPSQVDRAQFNKIWIDELQPSLATLSTRGKQVKVQDTGHLIPLQQPRAVVDAIKNLLSQLRK